MALFKICRGVETNLPTTLTSGYCYFCTDTTNFYIDYTDTYGALTRAKIASKYADKLRYTEDGNFIELDPTDIVTKSNYETAIGVATSDKNGLMSSSDKTKLDGVESGAQVNVQADYSQNDTTTADYIKNRTHYSEPYTEIPSVEPVDLLQHSIGDILRLDNQVNSGAIIMQVIYSLGTRYGGMRAAIRETTYNTDFKKVVTHDWDCSDTNVTIEEIGHMPTYEGSCNKLCHIARGSVELYTVYFIAYPAYLNDEYKTQFPGVGIYLKYVAKPVYASQYLNVSLVVTRYHSLSQHYLPRNVEYTANRVIAISAESDDTHYPTAKAVYDTLTTAIPTTLPNPNKLTFSGAVTGEYDGSSTVAIEIPKGGKASANFLIQPNGTVLSAPTYAQLTSGTYASFYALYGGTLYALSQQTQPSGTFTFKFNDVPNGKMYVVTVDSSDNTTFAEEDLPTTTVTLKTWTSADIS